MTMDAKKELQTAIGKRIKSCRDAIGMTQEELAAEIGISPHHLSNIERGQHLIKLVNLIKIAEIFSVSLDYLVFGKEKDNKEWASSPSGSSVLSDLSPDKKVRLNLLLREVSTLIGDDAEGLE